MSANSPIVVDEISSNPTDHFKVLETLNHGQKHFKCNYCNLQFKGTGTRCYVHLTGEGSGVSACTAVPENVITCIKAAKAKKQADSNRKRQASEAAAESKRQRPVVEHIWCRPPPAAEAGHHPVVSGVKCMLM